MKRKFKIIIIVVSIFLVLLVIYIAVVAGKIHKGSKYNIETDEYSRLWLQETIKRTPLLVFPEEVSDNAQLIDYIYHENTNWVMGTDYQTYLEVKYSDDDFKAEKERIASILTGYEYTFLGQDDTVCEDIVYDEVNYKYPAYVSVSGDDEEYALIDEENNRIIYVYLTVSVIDLKVDSEYLPTDYWYPLNSQNFNILNSIHDAIDTFMGAIDGLTGDNGTFTIY